MDLVTNEQDLPKKSKNAWARYIAVRLLSRFERSDSYLDKLLSHELNHNDLSPQDKALLTELVNGVIRWKGKLDWALTGFYNGDYQKCLNIVKNAMRVALYQIMFLNKIPVPAAIDESVEIIKNIQGDRTAGIVNGVLRNIYRNLDKIRYPDPEEDPVYYYSVIYSHPKWMVKRWIDRFGIEETEKLLIANNKKPPVTVRVNSLLSDVDKVKSIFDQNELSYVQSEYIPNSLVLSSPKFDLSQSELFKKGEITIQDVSASLAATLSAAKDGMTIIDLCAAPGGKSFLMAELMHNNGKVISIDKYSSKLSMIEDGAKRLGLDSTINAMIEDARNIRMKEKADLVFVDAPCSGLGTLQKKPDIKWKRDIDDLADIVELQKEIIENAIRLVKPGGVLVYSTCTIEPEENTQIAQWILDNYSDFELDPADNYLPKEVCKDGFMQTFPHLHNSDGAFAARFKRKA